jgi:hypothetical protein
VYFTSPNMKISVAFLRTLNGRWRNVGWSVVTNLRQLTSEKSRCLHFWLGDLQLGPICWRSPLLFPPGRDGLLGESSGMVVEKRMSHEHLLF